MSPQARIAPGGAWTLRIFTRESHEKWDMPLQVLQMVYKASSDGQLTTDALSSAVQQTAQPRFFSHGSLLKSGN